MGDQSTVDCWALTFGKIVHAPTPEIKIRISALAVITFLLIFSAPTGRSD